MELLYGLLLEFIQRFPPDLLKGPVETPPGIPAGTASNPSFSRDSCRIFSWDSRKFHKGLLLGFLSGIPAKIFLGIPADITPGFPARVPLGVSAEILPGILAEIT